MDNDGVFINEAMQCIHHAKVESKANLKRIAALEAEVERLREACEAIQSFDWDTLIEDAGGEPHSPDYTWPEVEAMIRAALEPSP